MEARCYGSLVLVTLLALGFLLGLRHALDADHIAAVASLASRKTMLRDTLRISGAWGLGHAATLLVFGGALVLVGTNLPASVTRVLEAAVGVMLVILGVGVLRRLREKKIHFHMHAHGGASRPHVHLHVHARAGHAHPHDHPRAHEHAHGPSQARALLVGCVHGLAGTAGLVLLAVPAMQSGAGALVYLAVFGAGTVIGMMLFAAAISVPLRFGARRMRRTTLALQVALGLLNVGLGAWIAADSLAFML